MYIVIQVNVPPYTYEDLDTAIHLAEAALKRGHKVSIFLFADSVLSINSKVKPLRVDRNIPLKMKELSEKGVEIHICGLCAEYRGISSENAVEGPKFSGVPEMASLIFNADRYVNLMP
ncbi:MULTISPECIES: DsrE/DsrF/TusD sulfur relay family protein [Dictyoglomus]|jgi:tRNA 2-thiouridine synthesizing protein D|uniref:DsrE family protein n=1 Tax=Dictyoglomus turgidum (strain DSM 6724 / Z-1310) TaxID=515635 RepID=B8DZ72_DICTD|nr:MULTISPECIES: DsrE family protein [Dictyoglomus]ACK41805.1 DsrE family protein [Dictyoglomus turgidum DSM 6724]PNV79490.1 MAG: sulfur reduction protein DsrE [Dictyoglomus turgidum]HBU31343.1 sulfur reduction protein DsrE [Dictyoglomus sp.]